jgi:hypothetical protein
MTEPLVINRVVGGQGRRQVVGIALSIAAGVLLCGACLVASFTEDLDKYDQLQASALGAIGAVFAFWGFQRVRHTRALLFRGPVIRLDDRGVWMRTGSLDDRSAAAVPWDSVESVRVTSVQRPPGFLVAGGGAELLQFVAQESAVEHDPLPPATYLKATAVGLTPVAAAVSVIVGPDTADRIPRILDWLATNRPDLPREDARS